MPWQGWVDVMLGAVDANGIDAQPIRDNQPQWILFFVFFILFGGFFVVNLFVGVLLANFEEKKEQINAEKGGAKQQGKAEFEWIRFTDQLIKTARERAKLGGRPKPRAAKPKAPAPDAAAAAAGGGGGGPERRRSAVLEAEVEVEAAVEAAEADVEAVVEGMEWEPLFDENDREVSAAAFPPLRRKLYVIVQARRAPVVSPRTPPPSGRRRPGFSGRPGVKLTVRLVACCSRAPSRRSS